MTFAKNSSLCWKRDMEKKNVANYCSTLQEFQLSFHHMVMCNFDIVYLKIKWQYNNILSS